MERVMKRGKEAKAWRHVAGLDSLQKGQVIGEDVISASMETPAYLSFQEHWDDLKGQQQA